MVVLVICDTPNAAEFYMQQYANPFVQYAAYGLHISGSYYDLVIAKEPDQNSLRMMGIYRHQWTSWFNEVIRCRVRPENIVWTDNPWPDRPASYFEFRG